MRTTKDSVSPPGPPPGPALRPLSSSANDFSVSPLLLGGRPNQVLAARRGAVSGEHMAQMPTATNLFASKWAQEDSREDECLEPGMACLWCFAHSRRGSDLSSDHEMASHQAPTHNPARELSFGDFADYEITQKAPTPLEGDTLIDPENHQSAPVSPKTVVNSMNLLNRLAASSATPGALIRLPPLQVLPPSTRHLRFHATADEGGYLPEHTSNLLSRPRFAAQTTIDRPAAPPTHQGPSAWDLPIGESWNEAYRFKQEELHAWTARVWARNVDKNVTNHQRKGKEAEDSRRNSSRIISNDGDHLQHPQIRNFLSTSSSLPIIGESTSSSSAAARHRNSSSNTLATNVSDYRDSSGSYMPSSPPPCTPGSVEHWRRTSYDHTQEGQYYQSAAYNPAAPAWRRPSADICVIPSQPPPHDTPSHHQQQQQQASDPSPAKVTDIFSVRPLAIRRPFEPARYVDGGPHATTHPLVRPDGNLSHPLTTCTTLPNLSGVQGYCGYGGLRGAMPRSQTASEVGAEDSKNTCLWLEGLPPNITYAELISSIKNCGRIYSTYINSPIAHHQTSAAKLAFFTRAGAERLYGQATKEQFLIRNQRVFVRWNRNAYTENPRHGTSCSRILLIRGPKKWVNETTLTSYFTSLFWSNICRIDEVPMDVATAWAGSNWLENGAQGKLSLPEKFREFAAMRWEFASFHSQASSAKTAIESETAFGGLIKVNFLPDPCDYTGSG